MAEYQIPDSPLPLGLPAEAFAKTAWQPTYFL